MKKIVCIVLVSSLLLSLNSCEWVNTSVLGNPSKEEIASKLKTQQALKDSLDQVNKMLMDCQESLSQQNEGGKPSGTVRIADAGERYHVVVGCFLMEENADKMMSTLTRNGYHPSSLEFLNGYTCVSADAFDNLHEAYNTMTVLLRDTDFCPDDVWVYDTTQQLHR